MLIGANEMANGAAFYLFVFAWLILRLAVREATAEHPKRELRQGSLASGQPVVLSIPWSRPLVLEKVVEALNLRGQQRLGVCSSLF